MTQYCTATTVAGNKCPCFAVGGSDPPLCGAHNPQSRALVGWRTAQRRLPELERRRVRLAARLAKLDAEISRLSSFIEAGP